ncbi:MAG: hypothetical protein ABI654_16635 [Betaproteobacteria bacterium]
MKNLPVIRVALAACAALCACAVQPALAQDNAPVATLATQPRGVYATIDLAPAQDLIRRLAAPTGGVRRPAIREVLKDPSAYMPPVLYALANALAVEESEDAVFWYHVGRMRAVYDAMRGTDKTALGGVNAIGRSVTPLGQGLNLELRRSIFFRRNQLVATADKAIEWDAKTARNYDQRWIALFGKVAATSPGTDPAPLMLPESEWPAMLKSVHDTHLKSVQDFAAKK